MKVGKLLLTIEQEGLFTLKHASYTQYVQNLALENKINVSTFWRAKSSLSTYIEIAALKHHEAIIPNAVKATPEQLELYRRVKSIVPERLLRDLRIRMLKGENVRNELKNLWKIYKPLKKGKTERGRKVKTLAEIQSAAIIEKKPVILSVKEEDSIKDWLKIQLYDATSSEMQKANIVNALRANAWLRDTLDANTIENKHFYTGLAIGNEHLKFDAFVSLKCNLLPKSDNEIGFIGVVVLTDIQKHGNIDVEQYLEFTHFCYLAVPQEHIQQVFKNFNLPQNVGMISISEYNEASKLEGMILKKASLNQLSIYNKLKIHEALFMKLSNWK